MTDDKNTNKIIQTFHIGTVHQLNPVATSIVNNYYGVSDKDKNFNKDEDTPFDKASIRSQIMDYVGKTLHLVSDEWRGRYMSLWDEILNIDAVDAEVYNKGKQVGTNFNRSFVANIIHFLGNYQGKKKGMFKQWEAKQIAIQLEGTWECSTRTHLAVPPSLPVQKAILKLIQP